MNESSATSTWTNSLGGTTLLRRGVAWAGRHPAWFSFLLALMVRVAVIVILGEFSSSLVLDDTTYQGMAEGKASGRDVEWEAHTRVLYELTATLMIPLTALYEIFGPTPVPGQIFVAFAGAGVAALIARLLLEVTTPKWALAGGIIAALLPSQILWSTTILKDPLVWLMLVALAVCIGVANRSAGWKLIPLGIVVALLLILLAHLRLHTLVVACFALTLASFLGLDKGRLQRISICIALALSIPWFVGIGIGGLDLVTNAGSLEQRRLANAQGARSALIDPSGQDDSPRPQPGFEDLPPREQRLLTLLEDPQRQISLEEAAAEASVPLDDARRLQERVEQASQQQPAPAAEAPLDPDIMHLPRGLSAMLLEPFPWQATTSMSFRLAQFETIAWYPLLLLATIGLIPAFNRLRAAAFPLLAGGGIVIMYALTEGNLGTAYRHRGEFVWVVVFLAMLGASWLTEKKSRNVE